MQSSLRQTRRGAILALVCGAQFMVVLDLAVVNVALLLRPAERRAAAATIRIEEYPPDATELSGAMAGLPE